MRLEVRALPRRAPRSSKSFGCRIVVRFGFWRCGFGRGLFAHCGFGRFKRFGFGSCGFVGGRPSSSASASGATASHMEAKRRRLADLAGLKNITSEALAAVVNKLREEPNFFRI